MAERTSKLLFFSGWREAGRYFTGGRFKQENLALGCLEERCEVQHSLGNWSRLISDSELHRSHEKQGLSAPETQHFSGQGRIPGIISGLLAGSPRANRVPLQPVGVGIPLLEEPPGTKGPCPVPPALGQIFAFQEGVESM